MTSATTDHDPYRYDADGTGDDGIDAYRTSAKVPASDRGHSSACLDPGTLVYLWPPNEKARMSRPSLVRVERATAHEILGVDISSTPPAPAKYEVASTFSAGLRWTWELAALPQPPCPDGAVRFLDRFAMEPDERREFLFGPAGQVCTIYTTDTGPVTGAVTRVLMDGQEPMFVEVAGPADDPRGKITHLVRFAHITKIQRVERGGV